MVAEHERTGAGTALSSVNRHVIGSSVVVGHAGGEFRPESTLADRRLDADGKPGRIGQSLDEVDQPHHVGEFRVAIGAVHRDADRDTPGLGDFVITRLEGKVAVQ